MRPIYPWSKWMARKTTVTLMRGRDYGCRTRIMAQQIRNAAVRHRKRVSLRLDEDIISLRVTR